MGGVASRAEVGGLDHIPLAIGDLDRAKADFQMLGFVLKPGRSHDDGIRNAHVKFANGTEIELITAAHPTDALAREYVDFLHGGDGPAFWSLYDPDLHGLAARLRAAGVQAVDTGEVVTFPQQDPPHRLFFADRRRSPTDLPKHFRHPNTASRLQAVWVAAAPRERRLLLALGARPSATPTCAPFDRKVEALVLPEGDEIMLVDFAGRPPSRAVFAATVLVANLEFATRVLERSGVTYLASACARPSVWIEPRVAHGLWLELREAHAAAVNTRATAPETR